MFACLTIKNIESIFAWVIIHVGWRVPINVVKGIWGFSLY